MPDTAESFLNSLDVRIEAILDACTACGACARVCPTPELAGIGTADPEGLTSGVRDILRTGSGPDASAQWAKDCCGSAFCLDVCEHGINPRFMLAMARRALVRDTSVLERKQSGKAAFKTMSRGVRTLSRLQLSPEQLARLNPAPRPDADDRGPPDVIFYTGCNLLKTPHIGLLCLDVLDRLDVTYDVFGGPSNCCGILQARAGDIENAGRQAYRTLDRFTRSGTSQVLSWCPTCQIQFSETIIPGYGTGAGDEPDSAGAGIDMTMLPVYLAQNLDKLRPMMTRPVNRKVALHEYPGARGVTESVIALLEAVPGLDLVDHGQPRVGYTLASFQNVPDHRRNTILSSLKAAEAAGVDTFVGVYHSDHREFSAHEASWPFDVVNYMELVGESMGLHQTDTYKRLKLMQDADAILDAVDPMITTWGLDRDEARDVIVNDLINEQHLAVDRAEHPEL